VYQPTQQESVISLRQEAKRKNETPAKLLGGELPPSPFPNYKIFISTFKHNLDICWITSDNWMTKRNKTFISLVLALVTSKLRDDCLVGRQKLPEQIPND